MTTIDLTVSSRSRTSLLSHEEVALPGTASGSEQSRRPTLLRLVAVGSLWAAFLTPFCVHAEDLEQFFRKLYVGDVSPAMFHDQGRYIVTMGPQSMVMGKPELLQLYRQLKATGAKTEILSLKLIGKTESEGRISVVVRATLRQTVGNTG